AFIPAHVLAQSPLGLPSWWLGVQILHNTLLTMCSVGLIRRFGKDKSPFKSLSYTLVFTLLGILTATIFTQSVTSGLVKLIASKMHVAFPWLNNYWVYWRRALLSNVIPFLTVTPAIILWAKNGKKWLRGTKPSTWAEAVLAGLGLFIACWVVFSGTWL